MQRYGDTRGIGHTSYTGANARAMRAEKAPRLLSSVNGRGGGRIGRKNDMETRNSRKEFLKKYKLLVINIVMGL